MASLRDRLDELKSKYPTEELTKSEYLQLASEAIELHLEFARLAKTAPEKKRLTQKTNSILDEAEKVKEAESWSLDTGMLIHFDEDPVPDPAPDFKASPAVGKSSTSRSGSTSLLVEPSKTSKQPPASLPKSFGASLRLLAPGAAPTSSRRLPTHEQKLLWQNSVLHGCKFIPWESDPEDKEFELARGEQPFLCVCFTLHRGSMTDIGSQ